MFFSQESKYVVLARQIQMMIKKKDGGPYWDRLLKISKKVYICISLFSFNLLINNNDYLSIIISSHEVGGCSVVVMFQSPLNSPLKSFVHTFSLQLFEEFRLNFTQIFFGAVGSAGSQDN